eukprot:252550_1
MDKLISLMRNMSALTDGEFNSFLINYQRKKWQKLIFKSLLHQLKTNKGNPTTDMNEISELLTNTLTKKEENKEKEAEAEKEKMLLYNLPNDMLGVILSNLEFKEQHKTLPKCNRILYISTASLINNHRDNHKILLKYNMVTKLVKHIKTSKQIDTGFFPIYRYQPIRALTIFVDDFVTYSDQKEIYDFSVSRIPSFIYQQIETLRIDGGDGVYEQLFQDLVSIAPHCLKLNRLEMYYIPIDICQLILNQVILGQLAVIFSTLLDTNYENKILKFPSCINAIVEEECSIDDDCKFVVENPEGIEILHVNKLKNVENNNVMFSNVNELCLGGVDTNIEMDFLNNKIDMNQLKRLYWKINVHKSIRISGDINNENNDDTKDNTDDIIQTATHLFNDTDLDYLCINADVSIIIQLVGLYLQSKSKGKAVSGKIMVEEYTGHYMYVEDCVSVAAERMNTKTEIGLIGFNSELLQPYMNDKNKLEFRLVIYTKEKEMEWQKCYRCREIWSSRGKGKQEVNDGQ